MLFGQRPQKKDPHSAIVFGGDLNPDGSLLGPWTIARLRRLIKAVHQENRNIPHVILAAGFAPAHLRKPRQDRMMATMMRDWLIGEGTFKPASIHVTDDSTTWTCMGEIEKAVEIIMRKNLSRSVLAISSWNNVYPRLWMTMQILLSRKKGWSVSFACSWDHTVPIMHEIGGTLYYVPRALFASLS